MRDGRRVDDQGHISLPVAQLPRIPLDGLHDPAAILDNLDRIQRAIADDPAQAVDSAEELIESTAKTVLLERGQTVNDKDDIAALISEAQRALQLHPSTRSYVIDVSRDVRAYRTWRISRPISFPVCSKKQLRPLKRRAARGGLSNDGSPCQSMLARRQYGGGPEHHDPRVDARR